MLPPPLCGGGIGTSRAPAGGTPIVPQKGEMGISTPSQSCVVPPAVRSKTLR